MGYFKRLSHSRFGQFLGGSSISIVGYTRMVASPRVSVVSHPENSGACLECKVHPLFLSPTDIRIVYI